MGETPEPADELKIILVGKFGTGKTKLMETFVGDSFISATPDKVTKTMEIDGKTVKMQIWDTAGQERYESIGSNFFRNIDGCMLVYDITDEKSFNQLNAWKEECIEYIKVQGKDVAKFPFVVVGNKVDKEATNRKVPKQTAEDWCKLQKIAKDDKVSLHHYETSSKSAVQVEAAFLHLAQLCLKSDLPPRVLSKLHDDGEHALDGEGRWKPPCC